MQNKGKKFQPKEEKGQVVWDLTFLHTCSYQDGKSVLAVCKVNENQQVPKFNSFVYDKGEQQIGMIEEVFGPVNQFYVAFKPINNFNIYSLQKGTLLGLKHSQFIDINKFHQVKITKPLIKQRSQQKQKQVSSKFNNFKNNNNKKQYNNRNNDQNNFRSQGRFSK